MLVNFRHQLTLLVLLIFSVYSLDGRQPNIIYILADDLGIGDLSVYGQKHFETPHMDALAARGMRFMQHYSGNAVCAPSRSALLTGLHTGHTPIRGNSEYAKEGQIPMPADTYTIAHYLQSAGYKTGIFGKWGLGAPETHSVPMKMGFDRFYGYNCQRMAHSYYPAWLWSDDERETLWGNVAQKALDYAPDLIHEQTLEFIRENKERPFFVYYAAVQPHADMVAPEAYMEKFRGKYLPEYNYEKAYYNAQPEGHAAFAAMVNILDDYVGEVMAELDSLGIVDDTLVIFSSDNGPHEEGGSDPEYFDSNGIYKGFKRDLYEGGVRVPMIAVWPNQIEAGAVTDHLSAFWDVMPTVADLVGKPLPSATDGVSFLPTLLGVGEQLAHDYLYWEFHSKKGRVALRKGDWKVIRYNVEVDPSSPLELYNIAQDPGESMNVAIQNPEIVEALEKLLKGARVDSPIKKFNFKK